MANLTRAEHDPKRVEMSGEVLEPCAQNPAVTASSAARVDLVEVPCVIPSFAAASELVSSPYSCLVMNTHRRHVVLPPMYLYKKRTALREELQAELLKFSPSLQGVPLAYDNIQIVRSHGDIYDDSGYIHMDIQANFIIFQPQEGQRLLVNKLGVSHVGCLVHGCFNASIPKPNLVSVDTWRDAGPRIGAELEFEVVALDADTAGVLLIRGRLNRTRVQELLAITESSDSGVVVDQVELEDIQPVTEAPEESVDQDATKKKKKKMKKEKIEEVKEEAVSPSCQLDGYGTGGEANGEKKKKKKKRDKLKEVIEEMSPSRQDDGNATLELNGTESDANGEKKKKKKIKKEKRIKEEEKPVQISPMEIHASDSSGYHSDKPDKRKREKEIQVGASFSQEAFEPKSKKKKKENDIA